MDEGAVASVLAIPHAEVLARDAFVVVLRWWLGDGL
jgi:hypothetical protein